MNNGTAYEVTELHAALARSLNLNERLLTRYKELKDEHDLLVALIEKFVADLGKTIERIKQAGG